MAPSEAAPAALWEELLRPGAAALLEALAGIPEPDANLLGRLRRTWDAPLVALAIELTRARSKASVKFPGVPGIVADVTGVEQATSAIVAAHKAARFRAIGAKGVFDLCCGIGGDAMALARVTEVTAVDIDPVRTWMAKRNAGCAGRTADVRSMPLSGATFHLDPDRRPRGTGRRRWRYEEYEPGPAVIDDLLAHSPDGAIKLGPGVAFDSLPDLARREVEIIAEGRSLVQAVLWCGRLALHPGSRTATRLPEGISFTGDPSRRVRAASGAFGRYLFVLDPAVERAGLGGAACSSLPLEEAYPGLGILTGDEPVESPWLERFRIAVRLPWRVKTVKTWLDDHGAGLVTVRTRGHAIDAERAQRDLRGSGTERFTVFGLRLGRPVVALITRKE